VSRSFHHKIEHCCRHYRDEFKVHKHGVGSITCTYCYGAAWWSPSNHPNDPNAIDCDYCGGSGRIDVALCAACNGTGPDEGCEACDDRGYEEES
jgi:RecJ-like exonuclease